MLTLSANSDNIRVYFLVILLETAGVKESALYTY